LTFDSRPFLEGLKKSVRVAKAGINGLVLARYRRLDLDKIVL
jgi:hypothetical protein